MKKKRLENLKEMGKDQLIDDLMKKSLKGGCCSTTTTTHEDGSTSTHNPGSLGASKEDTGLE